VQRVHRKTRDQLSEHYNDLLLGDDGQEGRAQEAPKSSRFVFSSTMRASTKGSFVLRTALKSHDVKKLPLPAGQQQHPERSARERHSRSRTAST